MNELPAETLVAKKTPWHKRLWVRVLTSIAALLLICLVIWWWPRRTMVDIWRVNGRASSFKNRNLLLATLQDPNFKQWIRDPRYARMLADLTTLAPQDRDIDVASLEHAAVDEAWFARLKRLPRIEILSLRGDQLRPALSHLQDHAALKHLVVNAASAGQLAELRQVPQLEHVTLDAPLSLDAGMEHLAALSRLESLTFRGVLQMSEHLAQLPELPHVDFLNLYECAGLADSDLLHLRKMPRVNFVNFWKSGKIGDEGLELLAELPLLERLHFHQSNGTITDEGLKSLGRLKLKELRITGSLTPAQQTTLQQLLPGTTVFLR